MKQRLYKIINTVGTGCFTKTICEEYCLYFKIEVVLLKPEIYSNLK